MESEGYTDIAQSESIEPNNSADNILVLLNDDCLIQIFEYLPLCDLCNVADVCRVFKSNALSVFKRKHSDPDLYELLTTTDSEDQYVSEDESDLDYKQTDWTIKHSFPLKTAEKLFRHFGAYIKTLDLTCCLHDEDNVQRNEILEMLAAYCTDEDSELNKLVMNDVTIEPDLILRIRPLFDRLKYLDLAGGSISAFYIGPQLIELSLDNMGILSLVDGGWQENGQLSNVIKKMPNLEKFYLSDFGCVTIDVIKTTIENAPKLNMFVVSFDLRDDKFVVGKSGYNEICELIRKRLDKTKLKLELRGQNIKFSVPKCIVDMNRMWLEVVIGTFDDVQPIDIVDHYGFSEGSETSEYSDSD